MSKKRGPKPTVKTAAHWSNLEILGIEEDPDENESGYIFCHRPQVSAKTVKSKSLQGEPAF